MKIMICDDSKSVHSLVEEMLEGLNIELRHFYNGREGVQAARGPAFDADLLLLDWEMPELSGIEALPEIRKAQKNLVIIMMTSKNAMSNIVEALEKGANEYMMKPFTKDILRGKLSQFFSREVA